MAVRAVVVEEMRHQILVELQPADKVTMAVLVFPMRLHMPMVAAVAVRVQ
jgi:hypothetical protein